MSIVAIALSFKCGLTPFGGAGLIVIYLAFLARGDLGERVMTSR
jgi:hypothetical protein